MKYVLVTKDESIVAAAKSPSAFPPGDTLLVFEDWPEALEESADADILFVDLLATLVEPNKIGGYEAFAHCKMAHASASETKLIVIAAPNDYLLDFMAGWPDFVFAHLPRPVTEKIFRRASTWV